MTLYRRNICMYIYILCMEKPLILLIISIVRRQINSSSTIDQEATLERTTTTRRTAVQETGVSRHRGGPPEIPRASEHYSIEVFKEGPQL